MINDEIKVKLINSKEIYECNSRDENNKIVNILLYNGNELKFLEKEDSSVWGCNSINILRFDIDDLVNIEIFYREIVNVLKQYKKFMLKTNKERETLRDNLKQTFSSELILNKLKIEKN